MTTEHPPDDRTYRQWEAYLGGDLGDANRALPTAEYVRLLRWLRDVCDEELKMLRPGEGS